MITLFGPPEPSLLDRLKNSVSKTRTEISARFEQLLTGDRPVDPALLAQLESALLSADIGVSTTKEILASLRRKVTEQKLDTPAALKQELKNQLMQILSAAPAPVQSNGNNPPAAPSDPHVFFVSGAVQWKQSAGCGLGSARDFCCRRERYGKNHHHR